MWALAAESDERAWHLFKTREAWRVGFERGLRLPLVSPEAAAARDYDDADRARIEALRRRAFVGTADAVVAKLRALAADLALDEIVVNTWTHDYEARRRSYELLFAANER